MSRTQPAPTWTAFEPLPGDTNWWTKAWSDGAGAFWIEGVPKPGQPSIVARSTDHGRTWSSVDFALGYVSGLRGEPGGEPWMVGTKGLLVTRRKGAWKRLNTKNKATLNGVWCASPELVVVCGAEGLIASSRDAGRTWTVAERLTRSNLYDVVGDGHGGYVAVGDGAVILRSEDGLRWTVAREPVPSRPNAGQPSLSSLAASGPGCFLAGGNDSLLRSDDGGRSWRGVTPPRVEVIAAVCATASGSWFVGAHDRIVRSDDRGETWQVEHAIKKGERRMFSSLHVDADGRGVAVGPNNAGYLRWVVP